MKIIEVERKPPRFTDALLYSVRRHGVIVAMTWSLRTLPLAGFFSKVARLCFLLVAAHLLGSFYWWHKDKLNWDV